MEDIEDIQRHIFNLKDYYFSEGSRFPALNHCKNHFYFEMMKEDHHLVSGEWFIPLGWQRGDLSDLLKEKQQAVTDAGHLLTQVHALQGKLPEKDYNTLQKKFLNLLCVAQLWQTLLEVFIHYTKYFETQGNSHETSLSSALVRLLSLYDEARTQLGDAFYVWQLSHNPLASYHTTKEPVQYFVSNVRKSFQLEKALHAQLTAENLTDFVICGGGYEGHKLMKEVNFSDTYFKPDGLCRIPGTYRGKAFSTVNAHGWFSHEIKVKPHAVNTILVSATGTGGHTDFDLTLGNTRHTVQETSDQKREFSFYFTSSTQDTIRIRFDRATGYTPFIYTVKVLS